MPLWTANDDPTGRPKYANSAVVYGVDRAEAQVSGRSVSPGWVNVTIGTGSVDLTLVNGGSGYTNADVITIDGNGTVGVVNATANVVVGFGANVTGSTLAVVSAAANATATGGASLLTTFANGDNIFVYTNSSFANTRTINKVVNSSFLNITSTWSTSNAAAAYGVAGIVLSINPNNGGGSGFTITSNTTVTTSAGQNLTFTKVLAGLAGRFYHDNLVVFKGNMAGDAEDTIFPDT